MSIENVSYRFSMIRFDGPNTSQMNHSRGALDGQAPPLPLGIALGITIEVFVSECYGHTGCRIAADSCRTRAVRNDRAIFIRAQKALESPMGNPLLRQEGYGFFAST
jgi:hypothetical protein